MRLSGAVWQLMTTWHGRACAALALLVILAVPALCQTLRIYHIDVEQGDATLLVSPSGRALLIDCGKNGHGERVKAALDAAGVDTVHHFVCTHYHEDHYGGIDELVEQENVTVVHAYDRGDKNADCLPSSTLTSATFVSYEDAIGHRAAHLMRGETIPLDPDVSVTCLAHGGVVLGEEHQETGENENDMSVALLVQYGGFRYFNGGDIEAPTERKIEEHDLAVDVDVCKANHHGSDTSSTVDFMNEMSPAVIIISNGNHGGHKHPREVVLARYGSMSPEPIVVQTNKYLKDPPGGNVDDAFIADLETTGTDGTILVTVDLAAGDYEVSYRDTTIVVPLKNPRPVAADVVIARLLPDPDDGPDRQNEAVELRNDGAAAVDMTGWALRDERGRVWTLTSMGTIEAGASATFVRNGMPMNLNNNGDHVWLVDARNHTIDEYAYSWCSKGVWIVTDH
ncbi:MAG: lamin tail domain-containing protein [Candidatus Eisenbacteria bacterium]|nr:lamin tail domain-containing protein [Candidatus Eisenbacteria bacterium]